MHHFLYLYKGGVEVAKEENKKTNKKQSTSTPKRPNNKKVTKVKKENSKSKNSSKTKKTSKVVTTTNKNSQKKRFLLFPRKINKNLTKLIIFVFGILLIFSSYAWFSTNLNVKIKTFNMIVAKNSDLTISFDGVNFDRSIELSKEVIYDNLANTYPNHLSQWPENGLIPVSSPGITNSNTAIFDMYETNGVLYQRKAKDKGFLWTKLSDQSKPREFNYYLAFDVFIKNETGSPISDNLYFDNTTQIVASGEVSEEMEGLLNSFRIGIVKIGSVGLDASVSEIQNISCNNACESVIYEPNSRVHTDLSIERASKYGVNLVSGAEFPTYAYKKAGGPIFVENSVSGSANLDYEYFVLQKTIDDYELDEPLFQIPNGITKARIYVWIEGQDIDSLETNSDGTAVEISINFVKDTEGYTALEQE